MSQAQLDFAELAKVRPAWVIEALHALASTDVVVAEKGMRCFEEDPYYSDELSNVTAPDVAFLLALLKPARHMCRQLTLLLGSLVALAPRADGETPTQRFQALDPRLHHPSEIAITTATAIRRGQVVFETLLDAQDAALRCAAAWALYQMAPVDGAALAQRLSVETDDAVRIALIIALQANGCPLQSEGEVTGSTVADVRRVVAARAPIDPPTAAAFARLLVVPSTENLLFANGMLAQLAASRLVQLGPDEPQRFELLCQAYEKINRLASTTVDQPPLAVIEKALRWVAFPDDTAEQCARDRSMLTAPQRFVLHEGIAEGFPRVGHEAQQAFLRGDAALDIVVVFGGQHQTIAEHVANVGTTAALLDPLFEALTNTLAPQRLFDLSIELLAGHLGPGVTLATRELVARWCAATVTEQRVADYLERLRNQLQREANEFESLFLFCHYIAEIKPSPPAFDAIALKVLAAPFAELPAWLLAFSSARRAHLVAQLNHFIAVDHWQFCDARELTTSLTDLYRSDQWQHDDNFPAVQDMAARLAPVPTSELLERCGHLRGMRKRALDDLLAKRLQHTSLTLSARKIWTLQLELRPPDGSFLLRLDLERLDQTGALDLLVAMIEQSPQCVVTVNASAPKIVATALRMRLNDRIAVVDAV